MKKIFIALVLVVAPLPSLADEATTSPGIISTPPAQTINVTVNIRYKESLVWNGTVTLTENETRDVLDSSGTLRTIASASALESLVAADTLSSDFNLSDLAYYPDYNSFLVNCLDITALSKHACGNWQYVVNSTYPVVGLDNYTLHNGDIIYFYFGSPRRVSLPKTTVEIGEVFNAVAETYNYTDDTWKILSGVEMGVTQPNPDDPYSPHVISSATTGSDGTAHFSLNTAGDYSVGLAADFYSPSELLTVITPPVKETPAQTTTSSGGRGGGSGVTTTSNTTASTSPRTIPTNTTATQSAAIILVPDDVLIRFDVSLLDFIKKYLQFMEITN